MARPQPRIRRNVLRIELLEDRTLPAGVGAFAPDVATWSLRATASAGGPDAGNFQFGTAGTMPLAGDWNGDGEADIGTFNRNTATWSLRLGASAGPPDAGVFQFGKAGWIPVVGDWNGDGSDDIGVYNPANAMWALRLDASPGAADGGVFQFGGKNLLPVAGDWNGDGTDGIGVFNRATSTWSLRQTPNAGAANAGVFQFGATNLLPVVGDWNGDGRDGVGTFHRATANWSLRQTPNAGAANAGTFQFGSRGTLPVVGDFVAQDAVLTLQLKPLDLDLLGLKVQSSPITVTVSAESGNGKLLGNVLNTVADLVDLDQINAALNNVLGATIDLLNSVGLAVSGVGSGEFDTAPASVTPIADIFVAPVHLDLMGVQVDTSPIRLTISAQSGDGLVLGNVLTALSDVFNPPLPGQLDLAFINGRLTQLLDALNAQIPGIAPAESPPPVLGEGQFLALTVPAIDLNLLGLKLETTPITVNATAETGNGLLLGNLLTVVFDTIGATPEELTTLNTNINNLLAKVVGVLNVSTLILPPDALDPLSAALQALALPDLVAATPGSTAGILDLVIATPDDAPPVTVDLLGVVITTSDINAHLSAETGEGQVLGNLLYNIANLLNPGGPAALINLLTALGTGAAPPDLSGVTPDTTTNTSAPTQVLTIELKPLDIDLLGLEIQSSPITVTISAQRGDGKLLGNVLTAVAGLLNTQTVSNALNNVLGTAVDLLNSVDLQIPGVGGGTTTPATTTPVLNLTVAPVHLDLLGVLVDTSPINLTITAHSGDGLILGNIVTELAGLLDPPLPGQLDLAFLNDRLTQLLADLNAQLPGIAPAQSPPPVLADDQFLALTVPAIDLDLLGLVLQTSPITVNGFTQSGDGELLGNLLTVVFDTLNATPEELTELNTNINNLLAQVVGVLNASQLVLPGGILDTLSSALQTLALPDLIATQPGATAQILDLIIASPDGTTPPVSVDLLGLLVTTSNIQAELSAVTGDGQILGNLLYNVANLLNPGGLASLAFLLTQLGE